MSSSLIAAALINTPSVFASDAARAMVPRTAQQDDDAELLTRLIRDFEASEEASYDNRRLAERDRDFKDGKQWTAEEIAVLKRRRQPIVWNNVIGRKIDLLRGMERRGRSDPKAYPRTPDEENRADVATQVLRYIADDNRFDVIRSSVFDNMLVEGLGGAEVIVEPETSRPQMMGSTALTPPVTSYNVVINHIPWERIFYDPHSQHPGFSDARYLGVVIWMDREEALDRYPGCENVLDASFTSVTASATYDDKPRWLSAWADAKRTRVRVVQAHWKRGEAWSVATFTRGGFLERPMPSPYLDRHGNPTCPLILRSAHIDRENNRFGVVRDMVPLQESINKRESKLLHSLSVNQIIMEDGAVEDVDQARQEAAKPDGVIVIRPQSKFEIHKDQAEIEGQFKLLEYVVGQMNVTGPNAAMSGKDPREQSGRAIIAQQAGGQVENEPMADSLRQWTHKVYEAAWMRARQFWTSEKMIRVTDSDKNVQFIGLNHQVTRAEELQRMDPQQAQMAAQQLGLTGPQDPRLQMVVRVENDIDDMDVDITVEEGPDSPTMQAEQFQALLQLPPPILAQFPPALIIKASSLRNKDDLLKMLEEHQQQQAQSQQAQQQMALQMQQAKVAEAQASAADKAAQARDRGAQTVQRLHGMATDHAEMMHQPVVPGVGVVSPDINPLLQPPQPQPPGVQP